MSTTNRENAQKNVLRAPSLSIGLDLPLKIVLCKRLIIVDLCGLIPIIFDSVLKEQWIRAKYERKEFVDGAPEPSYLNGTFRICKL